MAAGSEPFLADDVPPAAIEANRSLDFRLTARGRHVAFVGTERGAARWWAEDTLANWLAKRCDAQGSASSDR